MKKAVLIATIVTAPLAFAHSNGQGIAFHTGAPGEITCVACHTTNPLNSGPGSVTVSFANGATWTAGQTQRVTVSVSDPNQSRWGFEASPRLAGDSTKLAGTMAAVDGNEQVTTEQGVQFATHTSAGTRNGTTAGVTFEFDWTPPAAGAGNVVFYVAANAANGNFTNEGDRIYSTTATLTETPATSNKPSIQAENGVLNGASDQPGVVPGSWVYVKGTNLSASTRIWTEADIVNGQLPTSLDGVRVTVNGKPAFVYYISPTQVNFQAPDDTSAGPVNVVVSNANGDSAPVQATIVPMQPALFLFEPQGRKYPAAIVLESGGGFSYLGPVGLYATLTFRPAKPGDTIALYGTAFGPTNPAVPAGMTVQGTPALVNTVTATIGGVAATVTGALAAPGQYQFNITVPDVPDGDQPVVVSMNGQQTQSGIVVSIQR